MNIFDREVVETKSEDKKKAANQVEVAELKEYQRVVAGPEIGQKWAMALMGGLTAADLGDLSYWDSLGETQEERDKNYKGDAIQMLRWMATVGAPDWNAWNRNGKKGRPPIKDNDLTAYHILMTNEMANIGFWDLGAHPELQYKLTASVGVGSKQEHHWLDMPGKKAKNSKIEELIKRKYPYANQLELDIIRSKSTKQDFKNLGKDLAMDDKEINEILKDLK